MATRKLPPQLEQYKFNCVHGARANSCRTPEYNSWRAMKARCDNRKHSSYQYYGARGISYDPRWQSFETFLMDMGTKPASYYDLGRKDEDKGYDAENCFWQDRAENRSRRYR